MYEAGINPAETLYALWHMLLSMQGSLTRRPMHTRRANPEISWMNHTSNYPIVSYGARGCSIGVWGFDDNDRPIIAYGMQYRVNYGIHTYMVLDADGRFMLIHPHGVNHERIERHTFLGYTYGKSQYLWFADPKHTPEDRGSFRKYGVLSDWETARPFVYERLVKSHTRYDRTTHKSVFIEKWMVLRENAQGVYEIKAAPGLERRAAAGINKSNRLSERHYHLVKRHHFAMRGLTQPEHRTVRDGKTVLKSQDAVIHIAALLDVSQPAKAVPLVRTKIAEEATV